MNRLAVDSVLYIIGIRVILLVQFPPTEDFYSLETFKIISNIRSFRKSDKFIESFAPISLNTNMFFMKIYHNQKLLLVHKSVKFEY